MTKTKKTNWNIFDVHDGPTTALPNEYFYPPKYRSIVKSLILTLLTCGIYGIIWAIHATDEAANLSCCYDADSYGTPFKVFGYLISFSLYGIFWAWTLFEEMDFAFPGDFTLQKNLLYVFLHIITFGLSSLVIVQKKINERAVKQH